MSHFSPLQPQTSFDADHVLFWSNLARLIGLLEIRHNNMFFMTGLARTFHEK